MRFSITCGKPHISSQLVTLNVSQPVLGSQKENDLKILKSYVLETQLDGILLLVQKLFSREFDSILNRYFQTAQK